MRVYLLKLWASMNYRYCRTEQYLAANRGDTIQAAEWSGRAMEWQREYLMVGRRLV